MSIENENEILGAILCDTPSSKTKFTFIDEAIEYGLTPNHFSHHGDVFAEMLKLYNQDRPFNLEAVGAILPEKDKILADMTDVGVCTLSIKTQAKTLIKEYQIKQQKNLVAKYLSQLKEFKADSEQNLNSITGEFISGLSSIIDKNTKTLNNQQLALECLDELEDLKKGRVGKKLLNTGNSYLDNVLGRFVGEKKYITIISSSGQGKSTFAIDIASNMEKRGMKYAYFTQEMSQKELLLKQIANMDAGMQVDAMRTGHITNEQMDKAVESARFKNKECFIEDKYSDINEILLRASILIRKHKIDVIFIDYIQLFQDRSVQSTNRIAIVSSISQKIAMFTQKHDIPIFVVAQLNRDILKEPVPDYMVKNYIADSSQITKDTTYGLAVIVKAVENDHGEKVETDRYVYVTKARHGSEKRIKDLSFDPKTQKYNTHY
jgi:replicative DNA helicase